MNYHERKIDEELHNWIHIWYLQKWIENEWMSYNNGFLFHEKSPKLGRSKRERENANNQMNEWKFWIFL